MHSTRKTVLHTFTAAVMLATAIAVGLFTARATAGHGGGIVCPKCSHSVCAPTPTMLKDKKTAYHCDTKEVCIPGIRGPLAACDEPPHCGRVRVVRVLKKTEYECDRCGYSWTIRSTGCDCCR